MGARGSITALYTVLVDGDDMTEPVADAARSILDGHIVLSRELAHQGHYPAIDVLESVSRLMDGIVTDEHLHNARQVGQAMAVYAENQDLINLGAYEQGTDPQVDRAIALRPQILQLLRQDTDECTSLDDTRQALARALQPPQGRSASAPELQGEQTSRRPNLPHALASFEAAANAGADSGDVTSPDNYLTTD
jgi:flagellum-specific ATP synthase